MTNNNVNHNPVLSAFIRHQRRRGLTTNTIVKHHTSLRLLDDWARHRQRHLTELTTTEIDDFLDTRHIQARTRAWWLSIIHVFYTWCIIEGYGDSDPTLTIPRPKLRQPLPRPIATKDLLLAIEQATNPVRCWLILGALAGLRAQEIAGIERGDVMESVEPKVLVVVHAKGGKERAVPLHDVVLDSLRSLPMPISGRVFSVQPWTVSGRVNRHLHDLGIGATLHCCRHWFATNIMRKSHDLLLVQKLLGHASPDMAQRYCAFDQEDSAPWVQGLDFEP